MFVVQKCPVCEGSNFLDSISCQDYTVSHETFFLVKCQACDLLITSPRPNEQELPKYYQSDHYISHSNQVRSILDIAYRFVRHFTLNWKYSLINKYSAISSVPKKVLDIGCGTGDFLYKCKTKGLSITGVEPSENARKISISKNGNNIKENIAAAADTFDIITLWHVLEHLPNPDETLCLLYEKLTDSGIMFIAVPNHQSYDASYYKSNWAGYDVPRHLWHFAPAQIKKLIVKNNFTLVKIIPMRMDAIYVSMLSEKYIAGKQTLLNTIKGIKTGLISNRLARKQNDFSSLIYIVRKK